MCIGLLTACTIASLGSTAWKRKVSVFRVPLVRILSYLVWMPENMD